MREIKFRAWVDESASMRQAWVRPRIIGKMSEPFTFGDFDESYFIPMGCELDCMAVMQFTGLKDKNGREIYEGDLLRINVGGDLQDLPYHVEDLRELYAAFNESDGYMRIREAEVIGNVYENPELLV